MNERNEVLMPPPPPPNYACMCVKYCTKYSDTWKI